MAGVGSGVQAARAGGVAHRAIADEAAEGDRGTTLAAVGAVQVLVGHAQMVALPPMFAIGMSAHRGYAIWRSPDRSA